MDKNCSIVQDLLPLYAEDMVREETKEFVAGHLSQCETCRAELSALKADVTPAPVSAQPLRDLKKQLQRKRLTAVLLAVSLALTLATAAFAYLTAPQYLRYGKLDWQIVGLFEANDGVGQNAWTAELSPGETDFASISHVGINLLTQVSGAEVSSTYNENGKIVYFISAWRTPLDEWRGKFITTDHVAARATADTPPAESSEIADMLQETETIHHTLRSSSDKVSRSGNFFTFDTENCAGIYYAPNNGQTDILLYGIQTDGGVISLPRLALGYYVLLSLALFIALGIAAFLCRGKKAGRPLACLALIPASYLAGHLLVKGFTLTSYQMQRDFSLIILAAALVYAAVLLAASLRRQKQEKI